MEEIKWLQEGGSIPEFVKDISEQMGEGCLLIGGPSWIRTPSNLPPKLANRKMYIQRQGWMDIRCPICQAAAPLYVFKLEDDELVGQLYMSCCATCRQYGWILKSKEKKDAAVHGSGVHQEDDGAADRSGPAEPEAV